MTLLSAVESVFIWLSPNRQSDGLWLGVLGNKNDINLLARVDDALMLIKQHDQLAHRQIRRDIKRIWIIPLLAARGSFNPFTGLCSLDYQYVKSASIEAIASTIVHEATHAHPCMRKLASQETLRYRIERICMSRQLAFARKLPNGAEEQARIESNLNLPPSLWSRESRRKAEIQSGAAGLRDLGVPRWLIGAIISLRNLIDRVRQS